MNVEFEITLRCNAACDSCSRHCHYGMYDEASDVTMGQVSRFIEEVKGHPDIDMIHVMGGEPTLHPEFNTIVSMLKCTLLDTGKIKRLQIVSNGLIPIDPALGVGVCLSPPEKSARHRCMFVAPCDTGQELKDCPVPQDCGISFGAYGYWPCGAGGAICRLFGFSMYHRMTIPKDERDFPYEMAMCAYCQAKAKMYLMCKDFGEIKSISFRKAFREFNAKKLRRY